MPEQKEDPELLNTDWGDCGVVIYEDGNDEAWLQSSETVNISDMR